MAKTPEQVQGLFDRVWPAALKKAKREAAALQAIMEAEGIEGKLQPWDWWYYTEKLRRQKYQLSEADLKPYFELTAVRDGAFDVIGRLYGVKFKPRSDLPKYHEEVQVYEVTQGDRHLGILYLDFYPRPGKRPGAWKSGFRDQYRQDGKAVTPVITTVYNFPRPPPTRPRSWASRKSTRCSTSWAMRSTGCSPTAPTRRYRARRCRATSSNCPRKSSRTGRRIPTCSRASPNIIRPASRCPRN